MNRNNSFLTCIGIIAAYWALVLLGPGLVMLFNAITLWFSGGGFYEGSFGYKILVFTSQPIACALAHSAARSISKDEHSICVLVNEIISACIFVLLILSSFFLLNKPLNAINHIVSTVVTIICAVSTSKALANVSFSNSGREVVASVVSPPPAPAPTAPIRRIYTYEELEDKALEMGVSLEIAKQIINLERSAKDLPPAEFEEYK